MKTLNIFFLIIYWIRKVHNDFIFLRSFQCVQYKCSSVSELRKSAEKKTAIHEGRNKDQFWVLVLYNEKLRDS